MANSLAELVVNLIAETAAFSSKLEDAHKDAKKFAANIQKEWSGLVQVGQALVAVLAVDKFAEQVKQVSENIKQMEKLSQSYGLAIEEISSLRVASKLTGVDIEQLTVGMSRLAKNAAEVAKTGAQTGGAFKTLGVNVVDAAGRVKPMGELLPSLADKFSKLENGTGKTALAIEIFGRSGAAMIPFLNRGKQGMEEFARLADELGLRLNGKATLAAHAFQEQLELMDLKGQALRERFALGLFPALNDIASAFLKTKNGAAPLAATLGEELGSALLFVAQQAMTAATGLKEAYLMMKLILTQQEEMNQKPLWKRMTGVAQNEVLNGSSPAQQRIISEFDATQKHWEDAQLLWARGFSLKGLFGNGKGGDGQIPAFATAATQFAGMLDLLKEAAKKAIDEGLDPLEKKFNNVEDAINRIRNLQAEDAKGRLFPSLNEQANQLTKQLEHLQDLAQGVFRNHEGTPFPAGVIPGLQPAPPSLAGPFGLDVAERTRAQIEQLAEQIRLAIETERAQEQALSAEAAASGLYRVQLEQELINLRQQSAPQIAAMIEQYRQFAAVINDPKFLQMGEKFTAQLQTMQVKGVSAFRALATGIRDDLGNAFVGLVSGTQSLTQAFSNMAQHILADLAKMIYETILWKAILSGLQAIPGIGDAFSGPVSGAVGSYSSLPTVPGISPIFTPPGMASGGDVVAGQIYMVGEHGPEPFIPATSGTILPNSSLRMGGEQPNVSVNVVNEGAPKDAQVSRAQYDRSARQFIIDVVLTDVRQGGPLRGLAPAGGY